MTMADSTFLNRVAIKNYKSIAACDVRLGPLSFLVGPNGAGKSNFLDALRFVADSLRTSLDHALRDRGGIRDVRRRSGGHPTNFGIRLEYVLPSGRVGHYAFRVGARPSGGYQVQDEECLVAELQPGRDGSERRRPIAKFRVESGIVAESTPVAVAASSDRLYLVNASGQPDFRPVFEALSRMGFYSLSPDRIRDLQSPDAGELLARDGSNITSVLGRIASSDEYAKKRIEEYLSTVVPGIRGVDVRVVGPKETLEFRQDVAGSGDPWRFFAANMSDGTLRALGVLVALFQSRNGGQPRVPLIGIEEPEIALHPAATGALLGSLRGASRATQVLVTSHSPDLLDDVTIDVSSILAVVSEGEVTKIGPVDAAGRDALFEGLYTPGELLRLSQLTPDPASVSGLAAQQLRLFDDA